MSSMPTIQAMHLLPMEPADVASGLALLIWQVDRPAGWWLRLTVNDEPLATVPAAWGEAWLHLDRRQANTVNAALTDQPDRVFAATPALRALRDLDWPPDARVRVIREGQVIHDAPLWSARDSRPGFGGLFGHGGFGRDGATAPGLGLSELGVGPFGLDDDAWSWQPDRPDDDADLTLAILTADGRTLATHTASSTPVHSTPEPPREMRLDPDWTLHFSTASAG